ncbi:MAG TPA: SRPBCC family protein, partial [Candidatus Tectomicrobia bacterium]|nr:SRPBCC family protein [Candidatus Tectomicrobia bacterium]
RFTSAMLDDMNARHARDFADCSRAETVALLRKNAAVAAAAIRGMSDEALARSGTVLADRPPMTVEQLIMTALINHVDEHFGSIRRTARHSQVGRTIFALPSDREIAVTRGVAAPRDVVWKAWTSPDSVARWMLGPEGWTMPVCEIDLRPGGAWHFVWRTQAGETMEMRGVYQEVVPPARLVTIESWGGDWPETFNTLALAEENGIVTMTSTVRYPSREARDAALGTGMKDGWAASYDRLAAYLASGARP